MIVNKSDIVFVCIGIVITTWIVYNILTNIQVNPDDTISITPIGLIYLIALFPATIPLASIGGIVADIQYHKKKKTREGID